MINIAIIGYGKMGQIRETALRDISGCNIKYIYDFHFVPEAGVTTATSVDEIFSDAEIDAVFIATVNSIRRS